MAKKVYKIENFHGGINRKSDPRDIEEHELEEVFNASVSNKGRITMPGNALYEWYTNNDYAFTEYEDYKIPSRIKISGNDGDILNNGYFIYT